MHVFDALCTTHNEGGPWSSPQRLAGRLSVWKSLRVTTCVSILCMFVYLVFGPEVQNCAMAYSRFLNKCLRWVCLFLGYKTTAKLKMVSVKQRAHKGSHGVQIHWPNKGGILFPKFMRAWNPQPPLGKTKNKLPTTTQVQVLLPQCQQLNTAPTKAPTISHATSKAQAGLG